MRKIVVFMHVSIDGYVAGPAGEMDWINIDNEMFDLAGERTDNADIALYGRKTFEMMDAYWPTAADQPNASAHDIKHSAWYNSVDKVIMSRTMQPDPARKITVISKDLAASIKKIKQAGDKDIVIFGSPEAVQALREEGLVDEYWIFLNPVLLGQGISFFRNTKSTQNLKLVSQKVFSSGVVSLNYIKD